MRRFFIILIFPLVLFSLLAFIPQNVVAQEATPTAISTDANQQSPVPQNQTGIYEPADGSTLAGKVNVSGTATSAWVLAFSYVENPIETWFPLAQSNQPVTNAILTTWDTNSVTDGLYLLRLSVLAVEGKQDFVVKVRINNSLPILSATPSTTMTLSPTFTATATPTISPTRFATAEFTKTLTSTITSTASATIAPSLPPIPSPRGTLSFADNPATLNPRDIFIHLGEGILTVLMVFAIIGLIFYLRHK
jgi:hypothetical protein